MEIRRQTCSRLKPMERIVERVSSSISTRVSFVLNTGEEGLTGEGSDLLDSPEVSPPWSLGISKGRGGSVSRGSYPISSLAMEYREDLNSGVRNMVWRSELR